MSAPGVLTLTPSPVTSPRPDAKSEPSTREFLAVRLRSDIVQAQRKLAELRAAEQAEEAKLRQACDVAILYGIPLINSMERSGAETDTPSGLAGTDGASVRGAN